MKIKEYILVNGHFPDTQFQKKINELIEKGWQPYGFPISLGQFNNFLVQAMVIYSED